MKPHPVTRAANLIEFTVLTALPFGLVVGYFAYLCYLAYLSGVVMP